MRTTDLWRRCLLISTVAFGALLTCSPAVSADSEERPVIRVEMESYEDVSDLMVELNYTPEAWVAGIREVPRVCVTHIAPRWRSKVSKEVSVTIKKRIFFRSLGPLVLHSNEFITADRVRLEGLIGGGKVVQDIGADDRAWLGDLAVRYKVIDTATADLGPAKLQELLLRVDIVPPSLALAQGAEESGWATSRFAAEGNALFGQWSWDEKAIKPKNQRSELGNYGIAAFETPLLSVMAYMQNLNTHNAYKGLRARRAEMRAKGEKISGWELAKTLTRYSERGAAYVDSLHTIMRVNQLVPTDDAHLGDGPTYLLVPVGEGAR